MTKKRWREIFEQENRKLLGPVDEKTWPNLKGRLQTFIKEVDKLSEVYYLENPKEVANGNK